MGAWTLDYRPDFTAKETGLDTFINWDKEFIGKKYARKDQSSNQLVPLIVQTNDIDVTNNEAVMKKNKSIGYVTSGGFAHYVNKSIAFSYVNKDEIKSDKGIQIEINGDLFNCSIIKEPLAIQVAKRWEANGPKGCRKQGTNLQIKTDEVMKYCDEWGEGNKYDKDMVDWNYTGPKETSEIFNKHVKDKNIEIYDAGCGTGLVGVELKKFGFSNFHGADLLRNF